FVIPPISLPLIVHSPSRTASLVGVSGMFLAASSNTFDATHPIPPVGCTGVFGTNCFMAASHSATPGWLGGVIRTPDASQTPSSPSPGFTALKAVPVLAIGTSSPTLLQERRTRAAEVFSIPSTNILAPAFLASRHADV